MSPLLPPEIFEHIILDAVQNTAREERSLTALRLTHVCGSFRQLALNCPKLWTCLSRNHGRPGLALIEACIERSGGLPLDVDIYVYAFSRERNETARPIDKWDLEVAVDGIVQPILSVSERWRSCAIQLVNESPSCEASVPWSEFHLLTKALDVPMLAEFVLNERCNVTTSFTDRAFDSIALMLSSILQWNLPSLHAFNFQSYPVTFFSPRIWGQLDTLTLKIVHSSIALRHFYCTQQTSSNKMPLKHLRVLYEDYRFHRRSMDRNVIEDYPGVLTLGFHILRCTYSQPNGRDFWRSFNTMCFPDVVEVEHSHGYWRAGIQ